MIILLVKDLISMGMNYCPADLYLSDKKFAKNGNPLRNIQVKWAKIQKTTIPSIKIRAREQYPELSFLYNDFYDLYAEYENNISAKELFDRIESILKNEESKLDVNPESKYEYKITKCNPEEMSTKDIVVAWFFGELDTSHQNENNDNVFHDYIINKILN